MSSKLAFVTLESFKREEIGLESIGTKAEVRKEKKCYIARFFR